MGLDISLLMCIVSYLRREMLSRATLCDVFGAGVHVSGRIFLCLTLPELFLAKVCLEPISAHCHEPASSRP